MLASMSHAGSRWVTAGHHLVNSATDLHLECWMGVVTVGHQTVGQPLLDGDPGLLVTAGHTFGK